MDSVGSIVKTSGGSTLSHMIQAVRQQGILPTHFLLVNFGFRSQLPPKHGASFRKKFFNLINNHKYAMHLGPDDDVHITWKSANTNTSMLYYASSRFEETYVHQLTRGLIKGAYFKILDELGLTTADVQLNYLTTKNVNFQINIEEGSVEALGNPAPIPATPAVDWEHQNFYEELSDTQDHADALQLAIPPEHSEDNPDDSVADVSAGKKTKPPPPEDERASKKPRKE